MPFEVFLSGLLDGATASYQGIKTCNENRITVFSHRLRWWLSYVWGFLRAPWRCERLLQKNRTVHIASETMRHQLVRTKNAAVKVHVKHVQIRELRKIKYRITGEWFSLKFKTNCICGVHKGAYALRRMPDN